MKFRFFDILLSLLILVIVSPIIVIVSLLLFISQGNPLIFKQRRVGLNNSNFYIFKFRTLKNDQKDPNDYIIYNKTDEITFLGKYLRKFKIDELPQFVNVLMKDMSIVGPRPLTLKKNNELKKVFNLKKRHSVLPGITGLAQINGMRNISWNKRILLDIKYIDNYSYKNYFVIIIKTLFLSIKNINNIKND